MVCITSLHDKNMNLSFQEALVAQAFMRLPLNMTDTTAASSMAVQTLTILCLCMSYKFCYSHVLLLTLSLYVYTVLTSHQMQVLRHTNMIHYCLVTASDQH